MNLNFAMLGAIAFIAAGFSAWPIIGSYSKVEGWLVSVIIGFSTALAVTVLSCNKLAGCVWPDKRAFAILALAGLVNGAAFYGYAHKVSDPAVPTAAFVISVSITMGVIAPLLEWLLKGSAPSLRQLAGYAAAMVTIYLLNSK